MRGRIAILVTMLLFAAGIPLNTGFCSTVQNGQSDTVKNGVVQFIDAHAFPPKYVRSPSSGTFTLAQLAQKWMADVNTPMTQFPQPITVNTSADLSDLRAPDSRDIAEGAGQIEPQ